MSGPETLTVFMSDDDQEHEIPTKFEVCSRCRGTGSHVNPAIDGNGLSQEDFDEAGPEFFDDYMGGVYDVACHECGGKRVVPGPDWDELTKEELEAWITQQRELADMYAAEAAERRMGA